MNEASDRARGHRAEPFVRLGRARGPRDEILLSFLDAQFQDLTTLASRSPVVEILQHATSPPNRYLLRFHCRGLVRTEAGVEETDRFDVGLRFPDDYLRRVDAAEVVTLLSPVNAYHPNIRFPFICVGHLRPGTGVRDLVYQLYEMFTYNRVCMREDDALNWDACAWARRNQARFPLETRPLLRAAPAAFASAAAPTPVPAKEPGDANR